MIPISIQQYNNAQPTVNKMMNVDGSITTMQGIVPTSPSMKWLNARPIFNKTLEPDGSFGVFPLGGTGTGSGEGTVVLVDGAPQATWESNVKASVAYVDDLVGNIGSVLDQINRKDV